ncbi:MAG: hypothetical protein GKR77_05430 [Legionellales bacterium]|nr:hypothetical protein [Legionellales bacterium]
MTRRIENPTPTVWHTLISGAAAGVMDTGINYPAYGLKMRRQSDQPIKFSKAPKLSFLYQGAFPYVITIGPTTIIQFFFDHCFEGKQHPLGWAIASAMISGAAGAIYCTASEHIILTQQKLSIGQKELVRPTQSIRFLLTNFGMLRLWTGYPANVFRDGIFATAMLRGPQIISTHIDDTTKENTALWKKKSKYAMGVISTGILCSIFSHPFDTLSTKQQYQTNPSSMFSMAKKIYKTRGFIGFYPGFLFRIISVTGSLFVMPTTAEYTKNYLMNRP